MRPKNKLQQRIYDLSLALPPMTEPQRKWAIVNCLQHVGHRTKSRIACLDCGRQWQGPAGVKICVCPTCGTKIDVVDTKKRKLSQERYMSIVDARDGFQIVRIFQIFSKHKIGEAAKYDLWEIIQHYVTPDGKVEVVSRARTFSYYYDGFNGPLEIRSSKGWLHKYNVWPDKMYPRFRCLPEFKRNGFICRVDGISQAQIFNVLMTDRKAETLLKAKQYGLLGARVGSKADEVERHWPSIKIAIRFKYNIPLGESVTWLDYLDLLQYLEKDLRNPVYVCPKNLKAAHDRLVVRKREVEKRMKLERQRKQLSIDEPRYAEAKGVFFGLMFTSKDITVRVLEKVAEFIEEGDTLKHCVYTNKYYEKENSLVFSASIAGVRVETIEVSLKDMKVVQSRGMQNVASAYHDKIIRIMHKNMHLIKGRYQTAIEKDAA